MIKESLTSLVDKVIGKTGQLHSPAWWMHRIFSKVDEELTAVDSVATTAKTTADTAKATADSNKALLDAITASAVWPKPNDTAPLRIVATQDSLQGVVSRGELVWASEDADVIRFTRAEGGTGTTTVALNTTDKNYSLTLGAGESKAVLPATITAITTDADNDIEHVKLKGKLSINDLQFNQKFPSLKTADLAGLDYNNMNFAKAFTDCSNMESVDFTGCMNIVLSFQSFVRCSKLKHLDLSMVLSTKSLPHQCFIGCTALETLDVSNLDTSAATQLQSMFYQCASLTSLDLTSWNTSNVTGMDGVFQSCNSLATLKFGTWDMGNVTTASNMFYGCNALTTVTGTITGIKVSLSLSGSPLTNESAMVFINGLAEVTTTQIITFKATTYATLTEEQIAVATSKGWTVASA